MGKCYLTILLLAFVVGVTDGYAHPLEGTIVRQVTNPWGSLVGFGLANDGTNLYVTGATDGDIRVVDTTTLSVVRTIATPANYILGLEYHNGVLFASDPHPGPDKDAASRIYAVDASSGTTLFSFDAPDYSVIGLSMGSDGLLYAMDGYDSVGSSGSFIYAFDPADGSLVDTIDASDTLWGTDIIEWVGDLFLTDDGYGASRLSFYELQGGIIERSYGLSVPGISFQDYRGSTLMGDSLYLWGQDSPAILTQIEVPEPATILLVGLGAVMLRRRTGFLPSQE